jgi:hypothetical protein
MDHPTSAPLDVVWNPTDADWASAVGRFMLNMGTIETVTRVLVAQIHGTDRVPVFGGVLSGRVSYLRKRYPRDDPAAHGAAMNVFNVCLRLVGFRNIVAHSGTMYLKTEDGQMHTVGMLDLTPEDRANLGQVISYAEVHGRAEEAAKVGNALMAMQGKFAVQGPP